MSWKPVVLDSGDGDRFLFKIGLVNIKVSSAMTDNQYFCAETILPPGANVEPHSHPEAEMFYILEGEFTFYVSDMNKPITATSGAFINVPPHELHAFRCNGHTAGKIFGMATPGGEHGLESFFRQMGFAVEHEEQIPDLNQPIDKVQEEIAKLRK